MTGDINKSSRKRRRGREIAFHYVIGDSSNKRADRRILLAFLSGFLLGSSFLSKADFMTNAFQHNSCSFERARQFQFSKCSLPDLADDLLLSEAGFLLSHDAATGYLKRNSGLLTNGATNLYSKNQIGDVYQQLDDGARALDVRPQLLANGTVVLHHGPLPIAVTLERLVSDARRWAVDNPDELVLILHSNFVYPTNTHSSNNDEGNNNDDNYYIEPSADIAVESLSAAYEALGVKYVECSDVYGLTVGQTKQLAQLSPQYSSFDDDYGDAYARNDDDNDDDYDDDVSGGGYLLAMDRHDAYAGSCAKQNYVEDAIVTCYSKNNDIRPCTNRKSVQHSKLKAYALASANNEPTDSNYVLGPPASTDYYPFNEIQALWQVDGTSAALGVSHLSSIIDDNTKSHLNARVVDWIYDEEFDAISLLTVDHVQLNGNALTSVLRNRCGQSELSYDQYQGDNNGDSSTAYSDIPCGNAIPKPHVRQGKPLSTLSFFLSALSCMVLALWISVGWAHYQRHHDHDKEIKHLEKDLHQAMYHCGCADALAHEDSEEFGGDGIIPSNNNQPTTKYIELQDLPNQQTQQRPIRLPEID